MKMRTTNPAATMASGTTSHQEIPTLRYIRYQRSAYGTIVFTICQIARPSDGCWYFATIAFQIATSSLLWVESLIVVRSASLLRTYESSPPLRKKRPNAAQPLSFRGVANNSGDGSHFP